MQLIRGESISSLIKWRMQVLKWLINMNNFDFICDHLRMHPTYIDHVIIFGSKYFRYYKLQCGIEYFS